MDASLPAAAEQLLARLERFGVRLGLAAPRRLLAALGDPQRSCPVVLVAGTNGKGSTAAWLAAMASAAGYRTGLYTSPHLEEVVERFRLDGRCVEPGLLGERILAVGAVAERALDAPPTFFELLTAVAFEQFARDGAELAVVEVGLGGRLDATNAADPVLSLITEIGRDHERHLGSSLAAIAREKAGILRRGVPAVSSCSEPEAVAALAAAAARRGTELLFTAEALRREGSPRGGVRITTPRRRYELEPGLAGAHQHANLGLAVAAAELLERLGFERLDGAAIAAGARGCRWPGRLEEVVLADGTRLLLDAAHNPAAATALAAHLAGLGARPVLVYGSLRGKRAAESVARLAAVARPVILSRPPGERALAPAELAGRLGGEPPVEVVCEPERAVERALELAAGLPGRRVVVCGSIYLVGAVRRHLTGRFGVPAPAASIVTAPPAAGGAG